MPSDTLLGVQGLTVQITAETGWRRLVAGVDLRLAAGESVAIVGESGSGKSLTARALVGLLPRGMRAKGSIEFKGTRGELGRPDGLPRALRGKEVALLLQDPFTSLNPLMRCGAQVLETKSLRDLPRAQRVAEAKRRLAEVGITTPNAARRYPFEYSGGMRQRVALAAALATNPSVLIADEFTTALDVTTQKAVLELVRGLQKARGMGLILITHDLRMAFAMCERVYVMYAGSLMEVGRSRSVDHAPRHPYTLSLTLAEPSLDGVMRSPTGPIGEVPSAEEVRDRCAFASRCPWRRPVCIQAPPPLIAVPEGGVSACVRIAEIKDAIERARRAIPDSLEEPGEGGSRRSDAPPLLAVENLSKTYSPRSWRARKQTTLALDGVSLVLLEGESVGVVGESGSGKTTLARCIVGLEAADAGGRIEIAGNPVSTEMTLERGRPATLRRMVQYVFQDPYSSLNPMRSVGATLREAASLHRHGDRTAVDARVNELLELVGLPASYAARKPSALSGGERQRVAVARALALEPKLLICDEPVSALDVSVQAQVLELLRNLRSTLGISYLFISHDLAVVRQVADRVVVMHRGRVVETGTAKAILESPSHPYSQELIASSPARWHSPESATAAARGGVE
jgi:peptide/nickel transport system ATP-binding protein